MNFTRRHFIQSATAAGGLLTFSNCFQNNNKPNILIFLTDDMGFSDLGCYGGEIETPNLDTLANNGIRFTEFYGMARCWPTRATLLSGRYSNYLSPRQVTIPQLLKTAGYQTGMAGKWHLEKDRNGPDAPMNRGFDYFFGTMGGGGSYYYPLDLTRGKKALEDGGPDYYYTHRITEEAVGQIETFVKSGKPFFEYVAYTAPHWPLHAPEATIRKYISRYQGGWEKLRRKRYERMLAMGIITKERCPYPEPDEMAKEWEKVENKKFEIRKMATHAAMVEEMDMGVGEVIKALKRTGQFENTLILFTNDNGASREVLSGGRQKGIRKRLNALYKEKNLDLELIDNDCGGPGTFCGVEPSWANAANSPLRRYKKFVHEGGACVPCIVHWPKGLLAEKGSITKERANVVDVLATCMAVSGAEYPSQLKGNQVLPNEGRSMMPVINGGKMEYEYPYYFNHKSNQALIKGDWKILRKEGEPWQLFNITKEKTELTDYADKMPGKVKELAAIWDKRFKDVDWDPEWLVRQKKLKEKLSQSR